MDHLQWYDYLRMITGTLALIALVNIWRRYRRDVLQYTLRLEQLSLVFMAYLFLVFYGSMEQLLLDVGFGSRTIITFLVTAVACRASFRPEPLVKPGYHG